MIDKIKCRKRIGCDIHKQLIELLKYAQEHETELPERILENEYKEVKQNKENYPDWYLGLVGFCASFGAKYFGGYARDSKDDNSGKWSAGAIRNLKKQISNIKDVKFINLNFQSLPLDKIKNYVIYCDIPYRGTTKYATDSFPYEEFYEWVKVASVNNTVLISEYSMPDDFTCIWQKETKTLLDSNKSKADKNNIRIEKLFTYIK
ncbi:DNA adenine methylase [Congzhengia minquanensis]|uniref:DNA adenine methylase n=1 Tax=Congzhengia minquanensis TaxID=2763657 RepID=A0A926HUP1_9FIRM|nr:DNA adenine methylase [Congzhengia minquanensis]MBC8540782.1 DNA adenine methylase [Congzhengia minquanensis]